MVVQARRIDPRIITTPGPPVKSAVSHRGLLVANEVPNLYNPRGETRYPLCGVRPSFKLT